MCEACREVLWLRMMFKELGMLELIKNPTVILCDNQSAMVFSEVGLDSENSKHIDIKYCFVQQCVSRGDVEFLYVKSSENVADLFTKRLSGTTTTYLVDKLGLKS